MPELTQNDFTRLLGVRSPIDPPTWELVIDDEGWHFGVRAALPLMAYVTTLVLAPGGFVGVGLGMGKPWLVWIGAAMALTATIVLVALRKREVRLGPYAEWEHATGKLQLRRLGVELPREELHGLQLLHAHQLDGQGNPGAQISELNLVARDGNGALLRFPLVAWNPKRPIRECAERVAEVLELPLCEWRFGRQDRRDRLPWPRGRGPYPSASFGHGASD